MRRNTARARPWGGPDCPGGLRTAVGMRSDKGFIGFPNGGIHARRTPCPTIDLNRRTPVSSLAKAVEQCLKTDERVRQPMDFSAKLDQARTLADVLELVKRAVEPALGGRQAAPMLALASLGNHPRGLLAALYLVALKGNV